MFWLQFYEFAFLEGKLFFLKKSCVVSENELRSLFKNLDNAVNYLNAEEKQIEKEFLNIQQNFFDLNLVHPFNIIYEFITLTVENMKIEQECEKIRQQHDEVNFFSANFRIFTTIF